MKGLKAYGRWFCTLWASLLSGVDWFELDRQIEAAKRTTRPTDDQVIALGMAYRQLIGQ
jgi:hypothetical protein